MEVLIPLLVIVAVCAVAIWLIREIDFGPPILKSILVAIVAIMGLVKVLGYL